MYITVYSTSMAADTCFHERVFFRPPIISIAGSPIYKEAVLLIKGHVEWDLDFDPRREEPTQTSGDY